jgi:hypothetical protein
MAKYNVKKENIDWEKAYKEHADNSGGFLSRLRNASWYMCFLFSSNESDSEEYKLKVVLAMLIVLVSILITGIIN